MLQYCEKPLQIYLFPLNFYKACAVSNNIHLYRTTGTAIFSAKNKQIIAPYVYIAAKFDELCKHFCPLQLLDVIWGGNNLCFCGTCIGNNTGNINLDFNGQASSI